VKGLIEWPAHPARMEMNLPLQKHNITVDKSAVAGKDLHVQKKLTV